MADEKDLGWVRIHRKIQDCWIWNVDTPFDERSAWIDLFMQANHKDIKMLFGGELITVKRGERITSIRTLANRWKWSRDKVSRFLKLLESDNMITRDSDNHRTLLTMVNYGLYQDWSDTERTQNGQEQGHTPDTDKATPKPQARPHPGTNNNDNNYNNDKNENNKSLRIKETEQKAEDLFERLWKLYPRKEGKGSVSKTQKMKLLSIGEEELTRAINRYKEAKNGSDPQYIKQGSTFFNSEYVDYLDENYKDMKKETTNTYGKWSKYLNA